MALAGRGETASGADGGSGALLRPRLLTLLAPALLLGLLAAAVLAGCGKGGDTSSSPDLSLPVPCTNDATAEAIRSESGRWDYAALATRVAAHDATPIPPRIPDDEITCRIRRAILTADDLPGWEVSELTLMQQGDGMDVVLPESDGPCHVSLVFLSGGLNAFFQSGSQEPRTPGRTPVPATMLTQSVLVFEPGRASQFMAAARRSCWVPGDTNPEHPQPVPTPQIGDESIAFTRGTSDSPWYEALVRRGEVISYVLLMGDGADGALLEHILGVADERITALQPYLEPTPDAQATPTPQPPEPGSAEAILDSALPKEEELPRGWIESGRSYGGTLSRYCGGDELLPLHRARAAYSAGVTGALVDITIVGPEEAIILGSGLPGTSCEGRIQDTDVTWTFQPVTVPAMGDETIAWHAVSKPTRGGARGRCSIDAIRIRRGNLFAQVALSRDASYGGDLSGPVKPQLVSLAQQVDAKLAAVIDRLPDYAPLGTPAAR